MKNKLSILAFLAILALAALVRFYRLDSLVTPYWEEVALGYDAYSLSQTGADHHGNFWPIVAVESFGDWKPAGYFYALIPFIKVLGLNVLAVRLPSAIAGLMIVVGVFILLKQILPPATKKTSPYLPHLGMLVTAISPWAILFSRAAWEVNLATALVLWGIISFFAFIQTQKRPIWLLGWSILLLALSMYTYHATRLIAPLLGLSLVAMWFLEDNYSARFFSGIKNFISQQFIPLILGLGIAMLLVSPFLLTQSSVTSQRFKETAIFSDLSIINKSNQAQAAQPNIIGKVFYHRFTLFGLEVTKNFLSQFNPNFLFLSGDSNVRHSTQYFGQLYHLEAIYLFFGLIFVATSLRNVKENRYLLESKKYLIFLFVWLGLGIVPASLTFATPHALRILPTLPVWMVLITLGIGQLIDTLKKNSPKFLPATSLTAILLLGVVVAYGLELSMFWRHYTRIYPSAYAQEWQDGYEELIKTVQENSDPTTNVYITREQGRPAMYYWFYSLTNPSLVQAADVKSQQDQGEFLEFQNIKFINGVAAVGSFPALVAASPSQINFLRERPELKIDAVKHISHPQGEVIWEIVWAR